MKTRPYRMTARAQAAEQTGSRIVDAMVARFAELPYDQIRLEDVAADAGVTVQTVLRRFAGKHALMTAAVERELGAIAKSRAALGTGDPAATVADLVVHYEKYGALILKVFAEARFVEGLPPLVAAGRQFHLTWCRTAFEEHVTPGGDQQAQERRMAQVVVACDATTWRILRQDLDLAPEQVRRTIEDMLRPVLVSAALP
ncbi:TetR/AcrR family transcriptional regulator [Nocardia salmonicida]|uniref:TetR/AcrR family transcriptional regulator n=1 Tax=Nocardia salmonicida TaxID=53431 RepID=UPI0033D43EC4